MPREPFSVQQSAGSLQVYFEEVFSSIEDHGKAEPTSGILTLVTFCLLLGSANINRVGEIAKGCQPDWRLALGLHVGKGPDKKYLYQLFREIDGSKVEASFKRWCTDQNIKIPNIVHLVQVQPSSENAFEQLRGVVLSLPSEVRMEVARLILTKGGWDQEKSSGKLYLLK